MARKGPIKKNIPSPDTRYNKVAISKFINSLMVDGKKSTAESIFYDSLDIIKNKTKSDPVEVFEEAFKNIQPTVEVRSRRVGGAMDEMIEKANGKRTIPQIFFDEQHIGGYDEVRALEKENKLQDLLK